MPPDDSDHKTHMGTGMPAQTPLPANVPAAGQPQATEPPDPFVGRTLVGRYYVEKKLGEGGMGAVYSAQHVTLEKTVALKILHGEFTRKPDLVERFLLEAKAASKIRHENVIDISDFGQTQEGAVFFAMEFLEGKDLHDILTRAKLNGTPLPWSRTRNIFLQVCAALSAAHSKGIIHRDLKPENIYLVTWAGQSDFVKLLDFGIAKMTEVEEGDGEGRKLTKTGMLFGTPEYMSPEQARGDKADLRVDVYAMGCILYQLLAGDVPFRADNFMGILSLHLTEPPPLLTPQQLEMVGAPPALASVVMKSLAKEKEDRFQTIDEMVAAIHEAEGGTEVAPPPSRPLTAGGRKKTNWTGSVTLQDDGPEEEARSGAPLGLILGAILVLGAIGAAAFFLTRGGDEATTAGVADEMTDAQAEPAPGDPEPPPAQIKVALTSEPSGARVVDVSTGDELGTTPFGINMPGGTDQMRLRLEKNGFQSQVLLFVPNQDVEYDLTLKKATAGSKAAEPEVVVVPQKGSTTKPTKPQTKPVVKDDEPDEPVTKPDKPVVKDDKPVTKPDEPVVKDDEPDDPVTEPDEPGDDDPDDPGDPKIKNPFGD